MSALLAVGQCNYVAPLAYASYQPYNTALTYTSAPAAPVTAPAGAGDKELVASLEKQVAEQGDKVRELKGNKAEKAAIDAEVALLLDLKKKLSIASGVPLSAPSGKKGKKKYINCSQF